MTQSLPPTELVLHGSQRSLGQIRVDWMPQPGQEIWHEGCAYTVLERRHRYQFMANRYQLHKIHLMVQAAPMTSEKSWVNNRWVLGDATCRYSAQSELVRCAVNPAGPCKTCAHYELRDSAAARSPLPPQ